MHGTFGKVSQRFSIPRGVQESTPGLVLLKMVAWGSLPPNQGVVCVKVGNLGGNSPHSGGGDSYVNDIKVQLVIYIKAVVKG